MRPGHTAIWSLFLLGLLAFSARAENLLTEATVTLQNAGLPTTDSALLEYFRERSVTIAEPRVKALLDQLGHRSFSEREAASRALAQMGPRVLPFLHGVRAKPDPEIRKRVETILTEIERQMKPELTRAAARLLAQRKPEGAAAVLLAFLPAAENEEVTLDLRAALTAVALRQGKVEPVVVRAVNERAPACRAAAGVALATLDQPEHRASVRRLLKDEDPTVRAAVALQLALQGEKESIPVLIRLFETLPRNQLWAIEDLLYERAGARAPTLALGTEPATQRAFVKAWLAWWDRHGATVNLQPHRDTFRDWTLLVKLDDGIVTELDSDDKPRFTIEQVNFSLDAQTLPGDRVLLAEHGGNRVTERARDGTVLWEKEAPSPLVARRMPNGRTFIATKTALFEVDRAGNETFRYEHPEGQPFMRANRLPSGDLLFVTQRQRFTWLDRDGKERLSMSANVHTSGGRIDVQPNGNFLLPQMYNNKVVEYDQKGNFVRDFRVEQPIAAVRLANGHTLITSMSQMRAIEFDQTGKEVWEYKASTRVTRVLRR